MLPTKLYAHAYSLEFGFFWPVVLDFVGNDLRCASNNVELQLQTCPYAFEISLLLIHTAPRSASKQSLL